MMCIFGGGGTQDQNPNNGPQSRGASDQSAPTRAENYRTAQSARDPLGRAGTGDVSGGARRRPVGNTTLLTAGEVDTTGKKTLLGA